MIVLAIVAATVAVAVPRIASRNNKNKSVLRDFSTLSRQLHMKSKLNGFTYRLVLDLKAGASSKETQGFWVEKSESGSLVKPGEEKFKEEKDRDGKVIKASDFAIDTSLTKEPEILPSGMRFESVELSRLPEPITTGKAYIHFLPQGLVEESAIHLKTDAGQKWTIAIHPLTGKAEIITDSMSLQDIKSQ
jgi:general secretion pathway protein H